MNILNVLKRPIKAIDHEIAEAIGDKSAVAAKAALAEAPILDALLDGKRVRLTHEVKLEVLEN